ncbi:Lrp/AsnC family transcriptional regulator [Jannaschia aquimarina]|uniref:Lrp_6 protein n=1 Tax=Jannaschia aquimarina TaxID=935700 RepID=A0A0D1ELA6_9RHOB|nr:Lrp/AsnC family transcriptional regulator [Jannaschia aquimarina]KIT16555.1 Leucine-responsive regulatory protein [Jannaschia aquimarina]SNT05785.1 transcriptional regulator, AsnC family [Jannaschia aquimarina]
MDEIDRALLRLLQINASLTSEALGRNLGLSASQAGRRRARLEAEGYVRSIQARLDPAKLGLTVQAFVQVQMATHAPQQARAFLRMLDARPEIAGVWTLTGEADYLLRVWCSDLAELNTLIHQALLPHEAVARVHSQIVMDQPKRDAPLPV